MPEDRALTITLVQTDCQLGQPAANFARAETMIAEAAARGSDLVVLPELWSTAYDLEHAADHAASAVISPWGETLGEADESKTLLTVTVDLAEAVTVRQKIPVFADRRPDLYDLTAPTPTQPLGRDY